MVTTMKARSYIGDGVLVRAAYVIVTITALACAVPFFLMISNSLGNSNDIIRYGYKFIPKRFTPIAYSLILGPGSKVYRSYLNTILITGLGTVASMILTSAMAYGLSVKSVRYRNKIAFFVYFTMLFSGGLTPWYILCSKVLHLYNNLAVMVVPFLINSFYMFLLRNFFRTIPESMSESAKLDGANDIYILFRIILPLSLPAIATIALFYSLDYWNSWYAAVLFIDDSSKYPLQYLIIRIINSISSAQQMVAVHGRVQADLPSHTIRLATALVTIGPIVFLYPFLQKYFVKGLMIGAIKG